MRSYFALSLLLVCCASDAPLTPSATDPLAPPPSPSVRAKRWPDPLASLPHCEEQNARFCAQGADDPVYDAFCGPQAARVQSLLDLRTALRVDAMKSARGVNRAATIISGVAVAGHTTSLSARSVSAINPRVISMRLDIEPNEVLAVAFTRGEQFVEIATRDRSQHELIFYVAAFRQACNELPNGCSSGDLFTPAIESDWTEVSLYSERDLANTVLDCATCHQPDGPGTPKLLRMHELQNPWTHWFSQDNEGGRALVDDYAAAKGDEPLAGVDAAQILDPRPADLEGLIRFASTGAQPNEFNSSVIEQEVRESSSGQPASNAVPGVSATWRLAFERAQRGEATPVPYHDVKVTDPVKLARVTEAYRAFRAGELEAAALPDLRDVFPDDQTLLAEMGTMTTPGATGEAVLLEACSQCHNARLDQSLSRARFRADLAGLSREEKDLAIRRLQLPPDNPAAMPPARLRSLSDAARARAIEALQR